MCTTKKSRRQTLRKLEDLRGVIHTSEVPESLRNRTGEFEAIHRFVLNGVSKKGSSQAMYISGVPGTGKTATTMAVLKEVAKDHNFLCVVVNAMELTDPKLLFLHIYKGVFAIDNPRISTTAARRRLNSTFEETKKRRVPTVIVVDELDMLCTKRQDILYEIFNWTSYEKARVNVIAISNTLDLPERVMSQRISSRLGTNRVVFQPYTFTEIEDILSARLAGLSLIPNTAIEYVSRKVANLTGDMRKAMDLLRRGIEIAVEKGDSDQILLEHVTQAQKESATTSRTILGEHMSRHAFILFRAALSYVQSNGAEEFSFHELYKQYRILCTNLDGVDPVHDYAIHRTLLELCSIRLLKCSPGHNFPFRKISLGTATHDAQIIVKNYEDLRKEGRISYN